MGELTFSIAGRASETPIRITRPISHPINTNKGRGNISDPNFSNVSLLLHFDGSNGQTTTTDSSPANKSITVNPGASLSTAQIKFGSTSLFLNGTTSSISTSAGPLAVGANNFTIEGFIRATSLPSVNGTLYSNYIATGNHGLDIRISSGGQLQSRWSYNGTADAGNAAGPNITLNTWQHFAMVRNGSFITLYLDGVGGTPVNVGANAIFNATTFVLMGVTFDNSVATWYFPGYFDEFRVTLTVARYTANFTPPTAAFPSS